MLKELTLTEFTDILGGEAPAPGGGSVAAMAGSFSAALVSMVASLTIGKEDYSDVADEMNAMKAKMSDEASLLLNMAEEDKIAFNAFMAAMKLPKSTPEEKKSRKTLMQDALKCAASVPLEVARHAFGVFAYALQAAQDGNENAVSDAGVAAVMAEAAVVSACLHVKINAVSIDDSEFSLWLLTECERLIKGAAELKNEILEIVTEKIGV